MQSVYPERNIRVVNMGINGNTSLDLKARFESDALALKPDWLSIMVGVNDVWRQFDSPASPELWVLPERVRGHPTRAGRPRQSPRSRVWYL